MTVNFLQKLNAVWFLAFGLFRYLSEHSVDALVLNITGLICWHIIFADRVKK